MRISIIGSGYVGSVTGICLADLGHEIVLVDLDTNKVNSLNNGVPPVYESGLEALLQKNKKRVIATTDIHQGISNTECTFICVGTPSRDDGSIDLSFIRSAATSIGESIKEKTGFHTIVVKSTVLPGTCETVVLPLVSTASGKEVGKDFTVVSNPEFLREGNAVFDFFNPDRIVIGTPDETGDKVLRDLYRSFSCPFISTNPSTAEMIKYVSNAFLATKISFANEIGNLCKKGGIDVYEVFSGVGLDKRINPAFFNAGIGFGGSCFPKDVKALVAFAHENGLQPALLSAALELNDSQPLRLLDLLERHVRIPGGKIGVLGLAFKPDTDDIRESRAIPIIGALLKRGAKVTAYDPLAMEHFRSLFPQVIYADSPDEVLENDAVLIVTEWKQFESLDYHGKTVIDGRRNLKARKEAAVYEGVCW